MKFRKKPVVIEAVQFYPDRTPWPEGVEAETYTPHCWKCDDSGHDHDDCPGPRPTGKHVIHTLEGTHVVSPGDWVITGVAGERYPCKPGIFEATYERVNEEEAGDHPGHAVVVNPEAIGDPNQTPVVQVSPALAALLRRNGP